MDDISFVVGFIIGVGAFWLLAKAIYYKVNKQKPQEPPVARLLSGS